MKLSVILEVAILSNQGRLHKVVNSTDMFGSPITIVSQSFLIKADFIKKEHSDGETVIEAIASQSFLIKADFIKPIVSEEIAVLEETVESRNPF